MKIIIMNLFLALFFCNYAVAGTVSRSDEALSYRVGQDEGIYVDSKKVSVTEGLRILLKKQPSYRGGGSSGYPVFRSFSGMSAGAPPHVPPLPENLDQYPEQAQIAQLPSALKNNLAVRVHFPNDGSSLSFDGKNILRDIAQKYPILKAHEVLLLTGHSDSMGGAYYNLRLSKRRARSAANYLLFINPSFRGHLLVKGMGEMLLVSHDGKEDRKASRRVQLDMIYLPE